MKFRPVPTLLAALLAASPIAAHDAAAQDVAAGGAMFAEQCSNCHGVTAGDNGTGPTLAGIVGAPAGHVAGFNYSPAMKAYGKIWNDAALDAYLANPRAAVPGTRMKLGGIADPDDRANLIAYLKTLH